MIVFVICAKNLKGFKSELYLVEEQGNAIYRLVESCCLTIKLLRKS